MPKYEYLNVNTLDVEGEIRGAGSVNGIPYTSGNRFFVDSGNGVDNGAGGKNTEQPFATLDFAIGRCTADNGDQIILMPGHAETTTAIAADVAGITILGIGVGRNRPTLTATTAATDLIDVTAANIRIANVRLVGAASGCTSLVAIAANDTELIGCNLEHGAAPLIAVAITHNNDRTLIKDCLFLGTAAGPDVGVDLQGSGDSQDYSIIGCTFNYLGSTGLDLAGIRSSKIDTGVLIADCKFIGMDATAIDFNSSATGLIDNCSVLSLNATVAEMIDGYLGAVDCRIAYHGVSGAVIPATTATP